MSTTTPRIGLTKPDGSDQFSRAILNANSDKLDSQPGLWVCTSTTRPAWTTAQKGQCISETDTRRIMHWDGSAWHDIQTNPPVFYRAYAPQTQVAIATNQTLQLTLGTITLRRPASIAVMAIANLKQMRYQSFQCNYYPLIDNGYIGAYGGTTTDANQWHTYGAEGNWNDYRVVPSLGMKANLAAGNHTLGIRVGAAQGNGSLVRASIMAFMVNSTDV